MGHSFLIEKGLEGAIPLFVSLQEKAQIEENGWDKGGLWLVEPKKGEELPLEHASDRGGIHLVKFPYVGLERLAQAYIHAMAAYIGLSHEEALLFEDAFKAWRRQKDIAFSPDLKQKFLEKSLERLHKPTLLTELSEKEKEGIYQRDYTKAGADKGGVISFRSRRLRIKKALMYGLVNLMTVMLLSARAPAQTPSDVFIQTAQSTQEGWEGWKPEPFQMQLPKAPKLPPPPDMNEKLMLNDELKKYVLEYVKGHGADPEAFILDKLRRYNTLVLGELHTSVDVNINLLMLKEMIPDLKALGLTHFVAEVDPEIFDEYLKYGTGIFEGYSYEWHDLVDSMLKSGIKVIPVMPYESGDAGSMDKVKDEIYDKDPEAKVLFYIGNMHASTRNKAKNSLLISDGDRKHGGEKVFWLGRLLKNYLGEENCCSICIKRTGDNQRHRPMSEPVFDHLVDIAEGNTGSFAIDLSDPVFKKVFLDGRLLGITVTGSYQENYDGFIFLEDEDYPVPAGTTYPFEIGFGFENEKESAAVNYIEYGNLVYYVSKDKALVWEGFDLEAVEDLEKESVIRAPNIAEFREFLLLIEKELNKEQERLHPHTILIDVYRHILDRFKDAEEEKLNNIFKE